MHTEEAIAIMKNEIIALEYKSFIQEVKAQIQSAQIHAVMKVNATMLDLYWRIGQSILVKQAQSSWGDSMLLRMSRDLQSEFPDLKGFSYRNLKYIRQWVQFWSDEVLVGQQAVAQLTGSQ